MTTVPVVARGEDDMPIGAQILEFSHRFVFLRLGKQLLLDNQTEGLRPEDIVIIDCRSIVSQGVLSLASVTEISRWRYPITLPEYQLQILLEERLGRNHKFSPDPLVRKPARLPVPPRRRKEGVEDHPVDPRRVEVRRRIEDYPTDLRRAEVPASAGYFPRMDLTEEALLDRMEKRLRLGRGGQDKVH